MQAIIGRKIDQSQRFLANGTRIPVTVIAVPENVITQIKTQEKDSYIAMQLGIGTKKKAKKALVGHVKKANLQQAPIFLREIRLADSDVAALPNLGDTLKAQDVFKPGDIVQVTGVSKGKGWAGVVKRYRFKGGPRTHGQSDRERAPGSIGQTTTPGRVYKGKRMAGRMGHEKVTLKNLKVVAIDSATGQLFVSGLIPGPKNGFVIIQKTGELSEKKFIPLFSLESAAPEPVDKSVQEPVSEISEARTTSSDASEVSSDTASAVSEENTKTQPAEEMKPEKEKEESADAKAMADKEDAGK